MPEIRLILTIPDEDLAVITADDLIRHYTPVPGGVPWTGAVVTVVTDEVARREHAILTAARYFLKLTPPAGT